MARSASGRGVWSGAGLVVANMIGVGVMISAGFMAQSMGPIPILLAWIVGAGIALAGVVAYSAICAEIGESGGEYRFLSDLVHPFLGYVAGWGSLVLGFSAAIAVDALAIGSYLRTLVPGVEPRLVGAGVVVLFTMVHAGRWLHGFAWQNALVLVKLGFLVAFVALGIVLGSRQMPTWSPPDAEAGFPFEELVVNQFWIAFAFSGWNAAIYLAREFRNPTRDVGRAMILGLICVSVLYLLINWVFVANLTPNEAQAVFTYEQSRITLGHLVATQLFGDIGGVVMSVFVIVAFISAISAMMIVGPRVYAAMAGDGFLPKVFVGQAGKPPTASVILQAGVVMLLLFSQTLRESLQAASAFLMLFTALTALSLFRLPRVRPNAPRLGIGCRIAAIVHASAVVVILLVGLQTSPTLWIALGGVLATATIGYAIAQWRAPALSASSASRIPRDGEAG